MSKRRKSVAGHTAKRPKASRFDEEQETNNSQVLFTIDEKRNFLKACQENGLSVIYDLKRLGEYLPTRSENEIRYLIEVFERRSRYKKENVDFEQTPLESWYALCDKLIRPQLKREDSSMLLIDLMSRYAEESSKYGSIYGYLKELMQGRYTSKPSAHDSIVFLCLIDTLSSFVQSQDLSTVNDYLRRLYEQLNEQLAAGERSKRSPDEVSSEYLNYFEQIDPAKLRDDIRLATAQLNRRVLDQQVAADERQLAGPSQGSSQGAISSNPISSQFISLQAISSQTISQTPQTTQTLVSSQLTNQQVNHLANQVVDPHSTDPSSHPETSEPTRSNKTSTETSTEISTVHSDRPASTAGFVSVANRDDESNSSNLTNQRSSSAHLSNKQARSNRDLISEQPSSPRSSARSDASNLGAGSTQQAATGRADQGSLQSQNPLYQYCQLPRIQKIRECLNPLGVSVEVLRGLHRSLKNSSF